MCAIIERKSERERERKRKREHIRNFRSKLRAPSTRVRLAIARSIRSIVHQIDTCKCRARGTFCNVL